MSKLIDQEKIQMSPRWNLRFLFEVSSWLFGLIGLLLAVYTAVHERAPHLEIVIASDTNVLDVHRSVANFSVLFQGKDIQATNQNLRIMTVVIKNAGDADILQSHFESGLPWGLGVSSGAVIEARISAASSDYLREVVRPKIASHGMVELPKIILDKSHFFSIELLILHPKAVSPGLYAYGKVAGIEKLVITVPEQNGAPSMLMQAFSGGIITQGMRLILYTFAGIVLVIAIAFLVEYADKRIERYKRNKRINAANSLTSTMRGEHPLKFVVQNWVQAGDEYLQQLKRITALPKAALKTEYNAAVAKLAQNAGVDEKILRLGELEFSGDVLPSSRMYRLGKSYRVLELVRAKCMFENETGDIVFSDDFLRLLARLKAL